MLTKVLFCYNVIFRDNNKQERNNMSKLLNNFIAALKSGDINAINKTANAALVYHRKHPMASGLLTAEQVIALDYLKSK